MDMAAYSRPASSHITEPYRLAGLLMLHHLEVRVAAGALGFVIFTQSDERPDGNNALQTHAARVPEHDLAVCAIKVPRKPNAVSDIGFQRAVA